MQCAHRPILTGPTHGANNMDGSHSVLLLPLSQDDAALLPEPEPPADLRRAAAGAQRLRGVRHAACQA